MVYESSLNKLPIVRDKLREAKNINGGFTLDQFDGRVVLNIVNEVILDLENLIAGENAASELDYPLDHRTAAR